jgi:putative membrane protein
MLAAVSTAPWRYQFHPEIWVLIIGLASAYWFAIRRIGPTAVIPGESVVTRRQIGCFVGGLTLLWIASDWPVHDISEEYLYSVHMGQHMALTYFMPPLMLMAIPSWLARLILGDGRAFKVVKFICGPVLAGLLFNVGTMVSHIPTVVNASAGNPLIHYSVHFFLVLSSLAMWANFCGPIAEWRLGPAAQMVLLFMNSIVPTVPAGWLTFADNAVYKSYDIPVRVWGLSVQVDQQFAGLIMKIGGAAFLWTLVVIIFFTRFMGRFIVDQDEASSRIDHHGNTLTFAHVEQAFAQTPAVGDVATSRGAVDDGRSDEPRLGD